MTRNFLGVQDFRFAGVCHLVGLLFVVVHCIPPPPGAAASPEESNDIAPDSRLLHINDDDDDGPMQAKSERTRLAREAVLPLGHRYIGLGKRLKADDREDFARGAYKRRYSGKEGSAMRFTGLGKRGGGGGGHSGLRFIGLGKRNPAAMRFIGLGKRVSDSSYEDGADGFPDLDSDEIEDIIGSRDYYSIQDRSSRK